MKVYRIEYLGMYICGSLQGIIDGVSIEHQQEDFFNKQAFDDRVKELKKAGVRFKTKAVYEKDYFLNFAQ